MLRNLKTRFEFIIGQYAWKIFLWSIGMSQEEYWNEIYEQEKMYELDNGNTELMEEEYGR